LSEDVKSGTLAQSGDPGCFPRAFRQLCRLRLRLVPEGNLP
jgi:hypothetical protein